MFPGIKFEFIFQYVKKKKNSGCNVRITFLIDSPYPKTEAMV